MHQMITGCWILLESRSVSFVSMKNPHYSKKKTPEIEHEVQLTERH